MAQIENEIVCPECGRVVESIIVPCVSSSPSGSPAKRKTPLRIACWCLDHLGLRQVIEV